MYFCFVADIFVGQLKSTLTCTHCGHTSETFEPFLDLSVPIGQVSHTLFLSVPIGQVFCVPFTALFISIPIGQVSRPLFTKRLKSAVGIDVAYHSEVLGSIPSMDVGK